uniref:Glycosyltransferase n=1 Tax=Davidia involucrata TaxID=16924 RepID=A0A5B6YHW8_DAVIN
MEREMRSGYRAHCLVLPYPTQGHINPMLQFSKRLEHKGIRVTIAPTHFIFKTSNWLHAGSIKIDTISDGYDEGGIADAESIEAYLARFREVGSQTLTELVEKLRELGCPVDCIVYDAFLPWALDVANKFGLVGALFFTQSCAVDNIYYHVQQGLLKLPLTGPQVLVPGILPLPLAPSDMPSFIYLLGSYPAVFDLVVNNQFSNIDKADWVLCNTFYELEEQVVDWMAKLWPLRTIGPNIPSMYLDKRVQDDREYGLNVFKQNSSACINWLNDLPNESAVYVSFGSLAELENEQMEELAWGLKGCNKYFLWVVRASEEAKLPKNFGDETSEKGLVVSWCPQLQVLEHKAIGCFVTHCGWNSTLEALSLGVPMVAMPQWTDQSTNAKYVMDVWGMGLRARARAQPDNDDRIVRRAEVEHCIREIMDGDRGKQIRRNATKWRELAKAAVDEGGSSDRNIDEFVSKLVHS